MFTFSIGFMSVDEEICLCIWDAFFILLLHVIVFLALNNYHMPIHFFPFSHYSLLFFSIVSGGSFSRLFLDRIQHHCRNLFSPHYLCSVDYFILFFSCFFFFSFFSFPFEYMPFIFAYPCCRYVQVFNFIRRHMLNKIRNTVCFDVQCAFQHFRFSL